MTTAEWEKRLCDNFIVDGVIGGNLSAVLDDERATAVHLLNTYRGQNILMESFQGFFVESLQLVNQQLTNAGKWPEGLLSYPVALTYFSNLFRRFRACEILYIHGYPYEGYSMLRDIRDRVFNLAAIARGFVTFATVMGASDDGTYDVQGATKRRKKAEYPVRNEMIGAASGLSVQVQKDLKSWDGQFHQEVHGGLLSLTSRMVELSKQGGLLGIGPTIDLREYLAYFNRSAELGWMVVRLLPFLQLSENAFGPTWTHKQKVLDDSFRHMVENLVSTSGKPIGQSIATMIAAKFAFTQPFHYFEPDSPKCLGVVSTE